jgi:uncharacterized protein YndB with AHSA1/START domain
METVRSQWEPDATLDEDEAGLRRTRFVRRLRHPRSRVWQALTEAEDLRAWFPVDVHGGWEVGAPLRHVFRNGEGPEFGGEVLANEEGRLLSFTWGDEVLRFQLDDGPGDGCTLTLSVSFEDPTKVARDTAGWHACLDRLGWRLADGAEPEPGPTWDDVYPVYAERFGPELSSAPVPHQPD